MFKCVQEKSEKLRASLSRCEAERRALAEEAGRAEQRAARAELQRAALEGDTRRLQLARQDKDAHLQVGDHHNYFNTYRFKGRLENTVLSSLPLDYSTTTIICCYFY